MNLIPSERVAILTISAGVDANRVWLISNGGRKGPSAPTPFLSTHFHKHYCPCWLISLSFDRIPIPSAKGKPRKRHKWLLRTVVVHLDFSLEDGWCLLVEQWLADRTSSNFCKASSNHSLSKAQTSVRTKLHGCNCPAWLHFREWSMTP